jgi:hypothetical protein
MHLMKLALTTCVIYVFVTAVIEIGMRVLGRALGSFSIGARPWGWVCIFGIVWLISFSIAWKILLRGSSGLSL